METETTTKKNPPVRGKVGRVQYKLWKQTDERGKSRHSFDLFRSYTSKKNDGAWVESFNFSLPDIKLLRLALDEIETQLGAAIVGEA